MFDILEGGFYGNDEDEGEIGFKVNGIVCKLCFCNVIRGC